MNSRTRAALLAVGLTLSAPVLANKCSTPSGFVLSDSSYSLSELSAPVSLVNLWAVWCPPCLKELPALDSIAISDVYSIETIHIGDNKNAIEAQFDRLGIENLPKTLEPNMTRLHELGFQGLPATMVIINGREQFRYSGYIVHEPEVLDQWLTCLSQEV